MSQIDLTQSDLFGGDSTPDPASATGHIDPTLLALPIRHAITLSDTVIISADGDDGVLTIETPTVDDPSIQLFTEIPASDCEGFDVETGEVVRGKFDPEQVLSLLSMYEHTDPTPQQDTIEVELTQTPGEQVLRIEDDEISGETVSDDEAEFEMITVGGSHVDLIVENGYDLKGAFRSLDRAVFQVSMDMAEEYSTATRRYWFTVHEYSDEFPESGEDYAGPEFKAAGKRTERNPEISDVTVDTRRVSNHREYVDTYPPRVWIPDGGEQLAWSVYNAEDLHSLFKRTRKEQMNGTRYRVRFSVQGLLEIEREVSQYGTDGGRNTVVHVAVAPKVIPNNDE